jgi:hypothetical protein
MVSEQHTQNDKLSHTMRQAIKYSQRTMDLRMYLFEAKDSVLKFFILARNLCDLVKQYVATLSLNC